MDGPIIKELEFKHLAHYLPYDLKAAHKNQLYQVVDLRAYEVSLADIGWVDISLIKPALRRIDDLFKNEWQEVFRAGYTNVTPKMPDWFWNTTRTIVYHDKAAELNIQGLPNLCLSYDYECMGFNCSGIRFNQLYAFDKLAELQADFYNLISAGLAVDINDY